MIKLFLICIVFTFPYQFQAHQPSIKTKSITSDAHVSFPIRKSTSDSKNSYSGKKTSCVVDQLINKPTSSIAKGKTSPSIPTAPSHGSDSGNHRSSHDKDDVFWDDETEYIPCTPFESGVQCTAIGATLVVCSIVAAGLVVTAPLAIGAGFFALGAGFFMQDVQNKSVEKIAQEKLIVAVALEKAKEDKQVVAIEKAPKKDDVCITKCKEIKNFLADYRAGKKNRKVPTDHSYDAQQKEMQELIATMVLAIKIQELLTATSAYEKAEAIQKIVGILNQLQNKPELLFADTSNPHDKKTEQVDSSVETIQADIESLVSFFENIDCEEFLQSNERVAGRILATSAAVPVLIFSGEILSALGPLAPLGAAIIAGGLFLENREAIFNLIYDLQEGNYFKTSQEKLALEQLQKYFKDLDIGIDKIINIGHAGSIKATDIFMNKLQYGYHDDKDAQVLTIVDKHGNQTVFLISSKPNTPIRQLTQDEGISGYLFSQEAINTEKTLQENLKQQGIDAKKAQKQAEVNKVLAQAENKQPSVDKYNKLPKHDYLLPVEGSGRLFQAAYSQDGRFLRNGAAGYYDTQGNIWTLNEEKQKWVVTNSFNSNKFIVNVKDQKPPSSTLPIDTTSDTTNDDQSNVPIDPNNPVIPSDNISMDIPPIEKPVTTGCGGKGDHPDVPTILIHPMPEPSQPTVLIHPIPEPPVQESPGCGKPLPIDEIIDKTLPGCGGKIDTKPEDLIFKASPEGDLSGVEVKFKEKNTQHIFDDRPGHLIDTPENRERIEKLVKDPTKYLGPDKHGNWWYGEILPDGTQLWGSVWGDTIGNCGLNEIPEQYNKDTGLCKPSAPNNQKK